ncbi:hypothetical protein ACE6H2_014940 [Prunus campanulata]
MEGTPLQLGMSFFSSPIYFSLFFILYFSFPFCGFHNKKGFFFSPVEVIVYKL